MCKWFNVCDAQTYIWWVVDIIVEEKQSKEEQIEKKIPKDF